MPAHFLFFFFFFFFFYEFNYYLCHVYNAESACCVPPLHLVKAFFLPPTVFRP
jgi:hypothetical protein